MYSLRDDFFPVIFAFSWGETSAEDVEIVRRGFSTIHERHERFVVVTDCRGANPPEPAMRRTLGEVMRDFLPYSRRDVIMTSVVIESRLQMGALTALRWVNGDAVALYPERSLEKALLRCREAAEAEGVYLPEGALVFARSVDRAQSDAPVLERFRRQSRSGAHRLRLPE